MARPALFRDAAVRARRETEFGAVLSARRASWWALSLLALASALAALAFLFCGSFTRKEHVVGTLVPTKGLVKVVAPWSGTVRERHVAEGQAVEAGEVLLVVSSEQANAASFAPLQAMLADLRARRDSLLGERTRQAQIDQLGAQAQQDRERGLRDELAQAQSQLALQRERVAASERAAGRQQKLLDEHFVSAAAVEQLRDTVLEARGQLAATLRSITALQRDIDTARLDAEAALLKRSTDVAAIDRQVAELEQQQAELESRRSVVLRAPVAGTVTTILAEVGQPAAQGTPLLTVLPRGAVLEAQLLVPTRAAGFVRARQAVTLRFPSFPYQRFGHHTGEVVSVGRSALQPGDAGMPASVTEPVYLVTVRLPRQSVAAYGRDEALQAGMLVDADVHVDRRRLIEWIFDPVLSVGARI